MSRKRPGFSEHGSEHITMIVDSSDTNPQMMDKPVLMTEQQSKLDGFKPLDIYDKEIITKYLKQDPPRISELTFTNLFIWRHRSQIHWREFEGSLLIIMDPLDGTSYGLPPMGTGDKSLALDFLCKELGKITDDVRVGRVDKCSVEQYVHPDKYQVIPDPDQGDYVYLTDNLINLSGRKYHRKKNHVNRFYRENDFEYEKLDIDQVECFLEMQEDWCQIRNCAENLELLQEDRAIFEAMKFFEDLDFQGGAIKINNKIEAFSLGEPINSDTAVIHIEKANPKIPGIYAAINQLFCENAWSEIKFINREQDLGSAGLKKAKLSYHPHHMVNKFTLIPR
ncbi:MAG: DUF2156 domain-containing protein [Deltaproteobacteria bacterium]|nr:DUF2156 domain-containing protein [Deltaproteobacteria bacterium]